MSCTVRGVTGSWKAGSSERPLGDASFRGTTEDDSHALQFQNILWRFPAHGLDGILITQVQPSLGRVIGMGLPGVLFADRGIDASLGRYGMTADGVNFRKESYINVRRNGNGRPHAGQSCSD